MLLIYSFSFFFTIVWIFPFYAFGVDAVKFMSFSIHGMGLAALYLLFHYVPLFGTVGQFTRRD